MTLSEPQSPLYNWKKNPGAEIISRPYNWRQPYREDDRNDETSSGLRVTRGGSWYSATTSRLGLMYREEFQPELSSDDLGFRVVAVRLPVAPAGQ